MFSVPSPESVITLLDKTLRLTHINTTRRINMRCWFASNRLLAALGAVGEESRELVGDVIAQHHNFIVDDLPAAIKPEDFDEIQRRPVLKSDAYLARGGPGFGSGRAIFSADYQLKGVGRTCLAGVDTFLPQMSGTMSLRSCVRDILATDIMRRVLPVAPLETDFVLVPTDTDSPHQAISGRRGSPFRLAHLELFWVLAQRLPPQKRKQLVGDVLESCLGPDLNLGSEAGAILALEFFVDRGIELCAHQRVFGLTMPNWSDNYDLFGRAFDLAESWSHFPRIPAVGSASYLPQATDPLSAVVLENIAIRSQWYGKTLFPLANGLRAAEIFGELLHLNIHKRINWETVGAKYRLAMDAAIGRLLFGLKVPLQWRAQVANKFGIFALQHAGDHFDWSDALEDVGLTITEVCDRLGFWGESGFQSILGLSRQTIAGLPARVLVEDDLYAATADARLRQWPSRLRPPFG